jgi:hypothetical protein
MQGAVLQFFDSLSRFVFPKPDPLRVFSPGQHTVAAASSRVMQNGLSSAQAIDIA